MKAYLQKVIVGILIGTLLTPSLASLSLPTAFATGAPVVVTANADPLTVKGNIESFVRTIDTKVTAFMTSHQWVEKLAELAKQSAYAAFRAAILDQLVNALIAWINNDGKGSIISDWGEFLYNAENDAAGVFINGISHGVLCSPFNLQVQLALSPVPFYSDVTCTLNDVVGNINSFMSDFQNGSWIAYQQMWAPQNNFYGATILGINDLLTQEYAASSNANSNGIAGQGFLSFTKCDYISDPNGNYVRVGSNYILASTNNADSRYTKKCYVTTPGQVAAEATKQVLLKIPGMSIVNSQDLSSYLTAIYNAALNKLTDYAKNGVVGLLADATKGAQINPVFPCAGLTGQTFTACMNSVNAEKAVVTATQDTTNTLASSIIDIRQQISDTLTQSIALESPYVDALTQLAACQVSGNTATTLATEQNLLSSLQDALATNQTYLDALNGISTPIVTATSSAVTPADLAKLQQIAAATAAAANNTDNARLELNDAQNQLQTIQDNVSANLPGVQAQLSSCPVISTTATTTAP